MKPVINTILNAVSTLLKCRHINGADDKPYLERFSILRTDSLSIYLHKFVDSDPDRGLHNHPFNWH